jgi:hypothetical protein
MENNMIILDLVITESDFEKFKEDIVLLGKIGNQFGADIAHLYAEICNIYGIKDESDLLDDRKREIKTFILQILANLSRELTEIEEIQVLIDMNDGSGLLIEGRQYSQIFLMLKNLKACYTGTLEILNEREYFSQKMLDTVLERIHFLYCHQFEELKARFKVVENVRHLEDNIKHLASLH